MPLSSRRSASSAGPPESPKPGVPFSMYGKTMEALRAAVEASDRAAYHARSNPAVLRAAGQRIEPTTAERLRIIAGHRQPWQAMAWGYRDMIAELRYALRFRANSISKVKIYVAEIDPRSDDDEPIPVSLRSDEDPEKAKRVTLPEDICQAAEAELARLPVDDGQGFLGVWSENFDVAGECYLHGRIDPITGQESWKIRSVDDVDVQGSQMTVKDELGQPRRVDLDAEELYRLWVPHPRRHWLADSALNALMDVLEDISLIGRELRAASRSRIAANGIWMIPDGMVRVKNTKEESDNKEDRSSRFITDLTAAMLAPIGNEGEAGAVMPLVLTGTRDDIETAAKSHIRFDREDSPTLLDKLESGLGRLATGLDVPPEVLKGMAEVNHWTAWQIDAATFKQFLEPSLRIMVDSLTSAQLRAALTKQGFPPEQISRIRYWFEAGGITENPNRRQDALDARSHFAISDKAFRDALGFSDADAPSPEEVMAMIAGKVGFDQASAAAVLRWAIEQAGGELPPMPEAMPTQLPAARSAPPAAPDATGTGGTGTPDTAPPAVAASGVRPLPNRMGADPQAFAVAVADTMRQRHLDLQLADQLFADLVAYADQGVPEGPAWKLDTTAGRELLEIERALRDRILVAADAALTRARERAGNRFRSKATKDPAIAASLREYQTWDWPRQVGREQCLALGADSGFLLAEAWEELSGKFARWVLAAIDRIVPKVLKLAGKKPDDRAGTRMREEMTARIDTAWDRLQARLTTLADRELFDRPERYPLSGEVPEFDVPPSMVRAALAEVGGLPETSGELDEYGQDPTGAQPPGLTTGRTVAETLEASGVREVGYLWVYGITPLKRQFEPHAELEGERFASWTDPKLATAGTPNTWVGPFLHPGDHRGCMCDFAPGYAVPDYAQVIRDRLAVPSSGMQDIITLAESDDQAGRTGTVAQQTRDDYLEIQRLQARFLDGE